MQELSLLIDVARGLKKADLILKNANIVNVFTGRIEKNNIAIKGNLIAGIGNYEYSDNIIDLKGKTVVPGLMDGHVHIESSMVTIPEFTRAVSPRGTTTVIIDPHEIANVFGLEGIHYMLKSSKYNPLNVFLMLPSCVPATDMETSGAQLTAFELLPFFKEEWVLGLGEMMNFPGLLNKQRDVLEKIKLSENSVIDGHAPGLSGKDLNAYIAAGVKSDHECTNRDEALEKIGLGMSIMIREGTAAKNLEALIKAVNDDNYTHFMFATDDRHPHDLIKEGHIDYMIKKAISLGMKPVRAVQLATINTANYFGLRKLGAIAPGYLADIVILDDFKNFKVNTVYKGGKKVAENGKYLYKRPKATKPAPIRSSVNIAWLKSRNFLLISKKEKARVIKVIPDQIITEELIIKPKVVDNIVIPDTERDILKIVVVERHHSSGNIGMGLVKGFNLKEGAIATTIAHDSHNIIAVGTNDGDIMTAVIKLRKINGGLVIVKNDQLVDSLSLPIGGLMAEKPIEEVNLKLNSLLSHVREMGCTLNDPFLQLSFLALPVIPKLKITDIGLIDVEKFKKVSLFV